MEGGCSRVELIDGGRGPAWLHHISDLGAQGLGCRQRNITKNNA